MAALYAKLARQSMAQDIRVGMAVRAHAHHPGTESNLLKYDN